MSIPLISRTQAARPELYEFGVGDRLRKLLSVHSVSVEGLASELGCNRNTIGNYLSGRTLPDRRTLLALAALFDVPMTWLETGDWAVNDESPASEETGLSALRAPRDSNPQPSDLSLIHI